MPAGPGDSPDDVPERFQVDFTGHLLLGLYRVDRRLAEGGMGSVYLAEDTNLGRRVVVKVPHARFLGEPGFRARFRREIEELVRLEHPHVARILARGEEDGVPYFVLQYLGGGSLEDRIARGAQPAAEVAAWLGPIARTLDFVHARGVVHRDVKPANILFDEGGHVFLSDFGVVKALGKDDGADLTAAGTGIGSPIYMAPEQSMGKGVSAASDQYALASSLYEALAGVPPYGKGSVVEVLVRKGREDPAPLRSLAPDVPPACEAAVARALSRDPAARFQTCAAFEEAFRDGLTPPPATPRSRTPVLVAMALLVATVVEGVFTHGFGLWAPRPEPAPAAPAATAQAPSPPRADAPAPESPMLVRVVERGVEPRRALRLTFASGAQASRRFRVVHHQSMSLGTQPPVELGGVTEQDLETQVAEVADDGAARLAWTFRPAVALQEGGATPESVALENKISGALGVITCVSHRSTTGALLDVSVKTESEADLKSLNLVQSYEELVRDAKGSLSYRAEKEGEADSPMRFERTFDSAVRER